MKRAYTQDTVNKLREIQAKFDEIDAIYSTIDHVTQNSLNDFHNEEYSLGHSVRWGAQAVGELIADAEGAPSTSPSA